MLKWNCRPCSDVVDARHLLLATAGLLLLAASIKAIAFGYAALHEPALQQYWTATLLKLGLAGALMGLRESFRGYQEVFSMNWVDGDPYFFFINGLVSFPLESHQARRSSTAWTS
jgi:hypothetical protein